MDIRDEIEKRYKQIMASEELKAETIHKDKQLCLFYKILSTIFFSLMTIFFIVCIFTSNSIYSYLFLMLTFVSSITGIILHFVLTKANKKSDKERIFRQVKNQVQKEKRIYGLEPSLSNIENIKQVTLLDSFTQVSDKLHAVLNYQEIIQKRYYKFKVEYKDSTTQIITTEDGSRIYNQLIQLVNTKKSNKDNTEEIRNYKKLLDEGIITKKEYETKKKQLLDL